MRAVSQDVFDTLSLLTPYDIDLAKVRIGNDRDGGYVLADTGSWGDVLSFGVGPDVTFEHDLASRGSRVFMHDHTVDAPPMPHAKFRFSKKGICGGTEAQGDLMPLSQHVANASDLSSPAILKIDIEGYEWDVFSTVSQDELERFDQIALEIHWLENLGQPEFRSKVLRSLRAINEQFTLFHVHGNNCTDLHIVDGFTVMSVLELSYIKSSLTGVRRSETVYPAVGDRGNHPGASDIPLLFFPFLPYTGSEELGSTVRRAIANS